VSGAACLCPILYHLAETQQSRLGRFPLCRLCARHPSRFKSCIRSFLCPPALRPLRAFLSTPVCLLPDRTMHIELVLDGTPSRSTPSTISADVRARIAFNSSPRRTTRFAKLAACLADMVSSKIDGPRRKRPRCFASSAASPSSRISRSADLGSDAPQVQEALPARRTELAALEKKHKPQSGQPTTWPLRHLPTSKDLLQSLLPVIGGLRPYGYATADEYLAQLAGART
jgi:hypothetical protein